MLGTFLGRSQATRSLKKFLRTLFNSVVHAVPVFGYFSHRRDKMPGHSDFRMKGFASAHNLRVRSIMTGKSRQWERKAAGHIASAVRERERHTHERWCSAHSLLFLQSRTPAHGIVLLTCRMALNSSLNPVRKVPHRYAQRFSSPN